ncbi:hypothetical protein IQ264_18070 [Phormidium sp. LEGE 05292]|uniref:hypothetical protein n=1 Tax=[Phormidium] sp. LEGE 05292 TaxID=767427 RepID=UPI00188260E4|nr:hypothetical protein [Phormidium sp. LEGE 05292]MBE9227337.1 hypothetical protein [Phormidium sp. LEGE 05292]
MYSKIREKLAHNYLKLVFLSLTIIPACFILILILKYAVRVPFGDQWIFAPLLVRFFEGKLDFADLISQHNDSRYLFPRLIFIPLAYLSHWEVRYEMLVTLLVACVVSFNIYRLNRLTVDINLEKRIIILVITNLFIFSPMQVENWLWGIQLIVFMPILCVTFSVLVAYSELKILYKFLICMALSTISTFSYANGVLCWVVVFPILAMCSSWTWKDLLRRKWLVVGWLAGFTANTVIYLYGYQKPLGTPSFLEAILHPQRSIQFFLIFLGSPLGQGIFIFQQTLEAVFSLTTIIGFITIILFIGVCFYLFKEFNDSALVYRMLGWIVIGFYGVFTAFLTTLGRSGWGLDHALPTRYITFSTYILIALIHTIPIIINDGINKGYFSRYKNILSKSLMLLTVIVLILQGITYVHGVHVSSLWRAERLQGKACLLFIKVTENQDCLIKKVHDKLYQVYAVVDDINQLGYLQPSLITTTRIKEIEKPKLSSGKINNYGWFEGINKAAKKDEFIARGWARLPNRKEPADAVVLTYRDAKNDDIIFAVSGTRTPRVDVVKVLKKAAYSMSGWETSFSISKLPKGKVKINAWAFDSDTGKAIKIGGTHVIENP